MRLLRLAVFIIVLGIAAALFLGPGSALGPLKEKLAALLPAGVIPGRGPATPPPRHLMPRAVLAVIESRRIPDAQAWTEFLRTTENAARYRFVGRASERLKSGHLLVRGSVYSAGREIGRGQLAALYGYPGPTHALPAGPVVCEFCAVGQSRFVTGDGLPFPALEYIYLPPAPGKPGDWMKNERRTDLSESDLKLDDPRHKFKLEDPSNKLNEPPRRGR